MWVSALRHPVPDPIDPRQPDLNRQSSSGAMLLVLGCRPWPLEPKTICPACHGNLDHYSGQAVCLWCHGISRSTALTLKALYRKQIRSADAGEVLDAERRAKEDLKRKHKAKLSERERRRYWMGVGSRDAPDHNIRVTAARAWLREIGQEPDWSLVLDGRGNVIGHVDAETGAVA